MPDLEAQRRANLLEKQRLLDELNITTLSTDTVDQTTINPPSGTKHVPKRRKLESFPTSPSRASARIAEAMKHTPLHYGEEPHQVDARKSRRSVAQRSSKASDTTKPARNAQLPTPPPSFQPSSSIADLLTSWNSWTPSAPEPTLTLSGTYHFPDFPAFSPNKSPLSILLEGAFGGAYFSPWHSRTLALELRDDYLMTLPKSWLSQLRPPRKYITSPSYQSALNKYQVACGQTLSEWEAAGWLNFTHDPRGWFEWYVRFFLGRRCDDDARQISRWNRCVGLKGRWRIALLKKYVQMGIRTVADEGGEDDASIDENGDEISKQVSPVIHQTCHHWGYEVRQEDLDLAWRQAGRG